jgi:tetratricopeptide (TPR) repeat protein
MSWLKPSPSRLILALSFVVLCELSCSSTPSLDELRRLQTQAERDLDGGNYAQAADGWEYIATSTQKNLGPNSVEYAVALGRVAFCWVQMDSLSPADSAFEIVEAILEQHPEYDSVRAAILFHHGSSKLGQKEYAKAIPIFTEALRIKEKLHGPLDPHIEENLEALDACYFLRRDFESALPIVERRLMVNLVSPYFHAPVIVEISETLWRLYLNLRRYGQGVRFFSKAIAAVDSGLARDNRRRPLPLLRLEYAGYLYSLNEDQESADMFKKALSSAEEIYGPKSREFARYLEYHANVLRQIGSIREAEEIQEKVNSISPADSQ